MSTVTVTFKDGARAAWPNHDARLDGAWWWVVGGEDGAEGWTCIAADEIRSVEVSRGGDDA